MPRTRTATEPADAVETVEAPVEVKPSTIGQTLDFAEVLRRQRQLEADGLAVPPAEPPPRKKLRQM